jgi:hypothetical protein
MPDSVRPSDFVVVEWIYLQAFFGSTSSEWASVVPMFSP